MHWSNCEYELWILGFTVMCWLYYESHVSIDVFSFTANKAKSAESSICVWMHVSVRIYACMGGHCTAPNGGCEVLWSEAAEICINVPIDPVYWQLSLFIKSQASIKQPAVPLLTVGGRRARSSNIQWPTCRGGAGTPRTVGNTLNRSGLYLRECMKVLWLCVFSLCICETVSAGSFHAGRCCLTSFKTEGQIIQYRGCRCETGGFLQIVGVFSGQYQAPVGLWSIPWLDF